jgi:hypothetical protein
MVHVGIVDGSRSVIVDGSHRYLGGRRLGGWKTRFGRCSQGNEEGMKVLKERERRGIWDYREDLR